MKVSHENKTVSNVDQTNKLQLLSLTQFKNFGYTHQEACVHCNDLENVDYLLETENGEYVCEDCSSKHCERCMMGECEVETSSGEYICSDCYGFAIDRAYDSFRD